MSSNIENVSDAVSRDTISQAGNAKSTPAPIEEHDTHLEHLLNHPTLLANLSTFGATINFLEDYLQVFPIENLAPTQNKKPAKPFSATREELIETAGALLALKERILLLKKEVKELRGKAQSSTSRDRCGSADDLKSQDGRPDIVRGVDQTGKAVSFLRLL